MFTKNTKFCKCEEVEYKDENENFIYLMCKNCGLPVKRKPDICEHYLLNGCCVIAELNNYSYSCRVHGDATKCKKGNMPINKEG